MILDSRLPAAFSAVGSLIGGVGTRAVSDAVDLGPAERSLAGLWLVVNVATTATSSGAATAQFSLVSADNGTLTSGVRTHAATGAIALGNLIAGRTLVAFELPPVACSRYLGVLLTTGVASFTAGVVSVFITHEVSAWKAHAAARTLT